jgi:predicted PurR-regulated permease PerM
MHTNKISLERIVFSIILILLLGHILVIGQNILVPLAFGALFAFMLKPIAGFFERFVKRRIPSILLTMLTATVLVALVITLFSTQLVDVVESMPSIEARLNDGLKSVQNTLRNTFGLTPSETDKIINEQAGKLIQTPISFLQGGLVSSTSFLTGLALTGIYVFFFLLYRSAFKNFVLIQNPKRKRESARKLMRRIQKVIQQYLYGLLLVMLILGILNSLGLWIIGLEYAFFWGFLAAFLAIIPYIGTFIGGLLPFLYALATADYAWQPFAVLALFGVIQFVEGNLITPNVVGSSVKINPLAAIIALLLGNALWGIPGMILALPAAAVLKEALRQVDYLRPVSMLMSDELPNKKDVFEKRWDKDRYRLRSFLEETDDEQ